MIRVIRKENLAKVFATTGTGEILIASCLQRDDLPPVRSIAPNTTFYERKNGQMKTSKYALGCREAKTREFEGTPAELRRAFAEAGLPEPNIVMLNPVKDRTSFASTVRGLGSAMFGLSAR